MLDSSIADLIKDNTRPLTIDEVSDLLKQNGYTPYYFMNLAVCEAVVKDNHVSADAYLDYAYHFHGKFFDNPKEDLALAVNLDMAKAFIVMHKNMEKESRQIKTRRDIQ